MIKMMDKVEKIRKITNNINSKFQDVLEMIMFCYFDSLRIQFPNPPENRLISAIIAHRLVL